MPSIDSLTTYAVIDLDAIAANVHALLAHIGATTRLMAVVKANAYGHGAIPVAQTALAAGAHRLAVARPDEGLALRQAGIKAPILIMGYAIPAEAAPLVAADLTCTVNTLEVAQALSARATMLGKTASIHIKVDTGLGRFGLLPDEVLLFLAAISTLPGLLIEGIYTHFATADEPDQSYTRHQLVVFQRLLDAIQAAGYAIPLRHAANSAAAINLPETHFDAVRCGIALYGLPPSDDASKGIPLRPALSLKSRIGRIRILPAGSSVGYGRTYVTGQPTRIALAPIGYGDGLHRALSNRGVVLIRGQRAPLVGRVSMDQITVDVSHIEDVSQDDEVTLIGSQQSLTLTADDMAVLADTINYEVTTALLPRLPRVYVQNNRVVSVTRMTADEYSSKL